IKIGNNYRTKISCNNRSVFVRDVSQLSILPEHELIKNVLQEQNSVYIKLYVPELDSDIKKKSLIPLIPGYHIFMFFGGIYCSVQLYWCSIKKTILYEWTEFGLDSSFTNATQLPLLFENQNFLLSYIKNLQTLQFIRQILLTFLLGFTNTENVQWLRGFIGSHFLNIFDKEKQFYLEEKETLHAIKSQGWETDNQSYNSLVKN
ncbi:18852_t:CDS:2, partial [Gigaspora rosea]